jgi:two-component system, NtrC family, nitrogen regulation response regulator GlnG
MSGEKILLAEDDSAIRTVVSRALSRQGYEVQATSVAAALWRWIAAGEGDVVITDVALPDENSLDLLPRIRTLRPDLPVIVMSAQNTLLTAVRAAERGAFEYLPKPFDIGNLVATVQRSLTNRRRSAQPHGGEPGLPEEQLPIIGRSPAMQEIYRVIARLMNTDLTVLIAGESGTGKELVAAAVHAASRRANRAFVTVNCAAIPRDLVESEMFGHERGAFTGATERRLGRFELAHEGTLFLDEIGDLSAEAQAKLLRTLETGELQRIGAETSVHADVRVVSATNRRLEDEVASGSFREDLFFRLNVFPITLPPLRERPEDLPALVAHLAERVRPRQAVTFTPAAFDAMRGYSWPGNVRELANLVERLSILCGPTVDAASVRGVLRGGGPAPMPSGLSGLPLSEALDEFERSLISAAMVQAEGNVAEAARVLQTDRANLYRRMRRLGIEKATEGDE